MVKNLLHCGKARHFSPGVSCCELQGLQRPMSLLHLRRGLLRRTTKLPFRHPLPKLRGPTGNGRAFFRMAGGRYPSCRRLESPLDVAV